MAHLLLDLYGTVLPQTSAVDRARIEALLGPGDPGQFWGHYREMRPVLDVGEMSFERWWMLLARRAGVPRENVAELAAADLASGLVADDCAPFDGVLIDGIKCGIIANLPLPHARAARDKYRLLDEVDAVVFSCDVALAMPDERIFAVALDAMETKAADTIFVSSRPNFVEAADTYGLRVELMTTHTDLEELAWGH